MAVICHRPRSANKLSSFSEVISSIETNAGTNSTQVFRNRGETGC
jgi:hypothetical protein